MNERLKPLLRSVLPRRIRPRQIVAGPMRGSSLVTSWHDYPAGLLGRTERPLLEWFARHARQGETWIDVGAYCGYTAFALARLVGPSGRVFSFEPVATTAHCIAQGRILNRLTQVTVLPMGLSATETFEMRRLGINRGMADATLPLSRRGLAVDVPMVRFDWVWPLINAGDAAIHGVKIDVQGMELEALTGMLDALHVWRPHVVVELHPGVSRDDIVAVMAGAGYSRTPVAVEPVPGEETPLLLDDRSYAFHPA